MLAKSVSALCVSDLNDLISNAVSEGLQLEFKEIAIGSADRDKREFLADVSAFANASGGDIILGIREEKGSAVELCPIEVSNIDAEKLRILQILRDGLEPRLTSVEISWVPINDKNGYMIIRVNRSWAQPHRVTFNRDMNFFVRSGAGKHPMNVEELKRSFNAGAELSERLKQFHADRRNLILSDSAPVALSEGAKILMHILPLSAFVEPAELVYNDGTLSELPPMNMGGPWNSLYSIDGYVSHSFADETSNSYALAFRNGVIESAAVVGFRGKDEFLSVDLACIEAKILSAWPRYINFQRKRNVYPPVAVLVSLLEAKGYCQVGRYPGIVQRRGPRRPTFYIADMLVTAESVETPPDMLLKPIFDRMANAFGYEASQQYGVDGRRRWR